MKRLLAFAVAAVIISGTFTTMGLSVQGDITSAAVVADNYYGTQTASWTNAVLTETETEGKYILTNRDGHNGQADYSFYWTPADGALTAYGEGTAVESEVIPYSINGVPVSTMGAYVAGSSKSARSGLKSLVISEGITTVSGTAFRECSNLVCVDFPSTLTTIEYNAFLGCGALKTVNLEETSVEVIGNTAFKNCGMEAIVFPETLQTVSRESFYGCTELASVEFKGNLISCNGNGNTNNNQAAFYNTPKLLTISFCGKTAPTTVSGFLYAGADNSVTVYYPDDGEGYTDEAFTSGFRAGTQFVAVAEETNPGAVQVPVTADKDWYGNDTWEDAYITPTETEGLYILTNAGDGGYSFYWTPSSGTIGVYDKSTYVESMVVPSSVDGIAVRTVGSDVFRKSISAGEYIVVSEGVTELASNSFRENKVLLGVRLPSTLTTIGGNAFLGSSISSINLEDTSVSSLGTTVFKQCTSLTKLVLPETCSQLSGELFYGCSKLTELEFLGNISTCSNTSTFSGCSGLEKIVFYGYTAPSSFDGFSAAGVEHALTVYYPQGAEGYDDAFKSVFKTGTEFIEMYSAEAYISGKPNTGEVLTGYFEYSDTPVDEKPAECIWQSSYDPDFSEYESIRTEYLLSGEPTEYVITENDTDKFIRLYINIPELENINSNSLHCISEPTERINALTAELDITGAAVDGRFYTAEGIDSYGGTVTVFNSISKNSEVVLVAAWYKGNELADIVSDTFSMTAGSDEEQGYRVYSFTGTQKTKESLEGMTLKVFALSSKGSVKPLCAPKACSGIFDHAANAAQSEPVGMYTREQLSYVREKISAEQEPWFSAYNSLIETADAVINEEPSAVEHWYVPGYYTNASGHTSARNILSNDMKSAYTCALAYQLTGRAKYADQTIRILMDWATVTSSMGSEDSGLVFAYVANAIPRSADLIRDYYGWDEKDKAVFDSWMKNTYLAFTGKVGGSGNSGDWGVYSRLAGKAYLGLDLTSEVDTLKWLISDTISTEDYSLPKENERGGNSMWYTYFALAPMTASCQIVYNVTGEDYFTWESQNNTSVQKALNTYFYYCTHKDEWPYNNPDTTSYPAVLTSVTWPVPLWEAMSGIYNNSDYSDYVSECTPVLGNLNDGIFHHFAWDYPTLMYGTLQLGGGLPDR